MILSKQQRRTDDHFFLANHDVRRVYIDEFLFSVDFFVSDIQYVSFSYRLHVDVFHFIDLSSIIHSG